MTHLNEASMSLTDTKLQILAEHYKNTFDFLQHALKQRNRLFIYVLCILIFIFFQLYTPKEASNLISQFITNKLGISTPMNLLFVQSVIWFGLLATALKYFQTVVFIERQYNYIHQLEKQLSNEYDKKVFTREGESYIKNYPTYLNWASFLYTILFPAILLFICSYKIAIEYKLLGFRQPLVWFNAVIFLFIVISVILYLINIHSKKEKSR